MESAAGMAETEELGLDVSGFAGGIEKAIAFLFGRNDSLRQSAAVVFRHAVLPFQKIGDRLRLNANFDAAETRQKQIHLVAEAGGSAQVFGGGRDHVDFTVVIGEQSPAFG